MPDDVMHTKTVSLPQEWCALFCEIEFICHKLPVWTWQINMPPPLSQSGGQQSNREGRLVSQDGAATSQWLADVGPTLIIPDWLTTGNASLSGSTLSFRKLYRSEPDIPTAQSAFQLPFALMEGQKGVQENGSGLRVRGMVLA